jgi:L-fucose mutarotase
MKQLLHPDILEAIARNGHGAKVLITDLNYPVATCTPPGAVRVFLNLYTDCISVSEVLRVLHAAMPVESAIAQELADGAPQPFHEEYQSILGGSVPFSKLQKEHFYQHANSQDNCLTIVTGDTQRGANIVLVMGLKGRNRPTA